MTEGKFATYVLGVILTQQLRSNTRLLSRSITEFQKNERKICLNNVKHTETVITAPLRITEFEISTNNLLNQIWTICIKTCDKNSTVYVLLVITSRPI